MHFYNPLVVIALLICASHAFQIPLTPSPASSLTTADVNAAEPSAADIGADDVKYFLIGLIHSMNYINYLTYNLPDKNLTDGSAFWV